MKQALQSAGELDQEVLGGDEFGGVKIAIVYETIGAKVVIDKLAVLLVSLPRADFGSEAERAGHLGEVAAVIGKADCGPNQNLEDETEGAEREERGSGAPADQAHWSKV
jgi:hypothetical protein